MSTTPGDVFDGTVDHYRGITVKTSNEICRSVDEFSNKLLKSLQKWSDEVSLLVKTLCFISLFTKEIVNFITTTESKWVIMNSLEQAKFVP